MVHNNDNIGSVLIVVASLGELKSVLRGLGGDNTCSFPSWTTRRVEHLSILHSGVGKVNAAGALAAELSKSGTSYEKVLGLGLAGTYDFSLPLKSVAIGKDHWMLDEGTASDETNRWRSLQDDGWAEVKAACTKGPLRTMLKPLADTEVNVATISTISGTDELAAVYQKRAAVTLETMESAALALVCEKYSIEFVDLRIVSNECGDRKTRKHDFPGALEKLQSVTSDVQRILNQNRTDRQTAE